MLWLMEQLTNKPDWHAKVHDDAIVAKWRDEALRAPHPNLELNGHDFSAQMFDYCLAELRDKAAILGQTGIVTVMDAAGCVAKSDTLVDAALRDALREAIAPLEDVPDDQKDWHPGSDGLVLDLVHPSLWPLVYGRSRVLTDRQLGLDDCLDGWGGDGLCVLPGIAPDAKLPHEREGRRSHWRGESPPRQLWSRSFQWLPCEVALDGQGGAKITSYVNNLHPRRHQALYPLLEQLIAKALPMWDVVYEQCYEWKDAKYEIARRRIDCERAAYECESEDVCDRRGWCTPDAFAARFAAPPPPEGADPDAEEEDDDSPPPGDRNEEADAAAFKASHPVVRPEPGEYQPAVFPGLDDFRPATELFDGKRNLQVIVKLASIHLTPEKPAYPGGSWHTEGQLNEHICATALYYYDSDNITDSHLAFRTPSDAEDLCQNLDYAQSDDYSIRQTFNIGNNDAHGTLQELGQVLTCEGRLLVFPNVYQHRVSPFELADKTKPGHRKIVALFLVDPKIPVLSTANVPPQRQDWWREQFARPGPVLGSLPPELSQMVFGGVDFPVDLDTALAWRASLIEERKSLEAAGTKNMISEWSFCEH